MLSSKVLNFFKKEKYFFIGILIMIAAGLVFPGGNTHAAVLEDAGGYVLDLIAPVIYIIFFIFFYIAYVIAWLGASIISIALNPAIINSVLNTDPSLPLYQAWTIFRDVANLLFILILLLIALGTIFRSETYNIKKSLYKFILVIFLINFSITIAGIFIDFGNILMYGILKIMCTASTTTCFQDFYSQVMGIIEILWDKYKIDNLFSFDFKDAVGVAIAAIYVFIYGLVLMALGLFLIIRMAVLAILIILAPLAFFGYVAPGLEGLKNKWWDNLIQYVMFGPVFALMLYVSGIMAQNMIAVDVSTFELNKNLTFIGQDIAMIIQGIIPLVFLLFIIPVTKSFGIAGTNAIMGATVLAGGAALTGAAKYAGGSIDRYMARGAEPGHGKVRRALSTFSPGAMKRAVKKMKTEQEHDYDHAAGRTKNIIDDVSQPHNVYKDWKNRNNPDYNSKRRSRIRDEEERDAKENWKTRKIDNRDDAQVVAEKGRKDGTMSEAELEIAVKFQAAENGIDSMLKRSTDAAGNAYGAGPEALVKYVDDTFKHLNKEEKSRLLSKVSKLEVKNGNTAYEGLGTTEYNSTTKQMEYAVNPMTAAINPKTGNTYIQDQENAQVKAANGKNLKDLKLSSFVDDTTGKTSEAGDRIFADAKGSRLFDIGKMDRDRVVELDKALTKKYVSLAFCTGSNPALGAAWAELKKRHKLP